MENFKKQEEGAKILVKEVTDAQRFGVAEIRGNHVIGIEEKPKSPKSNYAVVGIYLYDNTVFQKIHRLKPSGRGELEITDVNNFYIEEGKLTYEVLDGWWTDAGTFESLLRANNLVAETGANKIPIPAATGTAKSAASSVAPPKRKTASRSPAVARKSLDENLCHGWSGIHRIEFHSPRAGAKPDISRQFRQADLCGESRQSATIADDPSYSFVKGDICEPPRSKPRCTVATRSFILPRNPTWTAASTSPRRH